MTSAFSAVVLAGGVAARLDGADKASVELHGRTLLTWALEAVVDLVSPRYHPLAKAAKDAGAAAVLLAALVAALVGIVILGPRLVELSGR